MSPKAASSSPLWFRIAVQSLVVLAHSEGNCPSAEIAQNLDAHAVFLRRVLAHLARYQIVDAREGRDGGYRLARPADQITLGEIFRAVKSADSAEDPSEHCPATGVEGVLDELRDEAEAAAIDVLDRHTLASIIDRAGITPVRHVLD